jgi:hypothetical protein
VVELDDRPIAESDLEADRGTVEHAIPEQGERLSAALGENPSALNRCRGHERLS